MLSPEIGFPAMVPPEAPTTSDAALDPDADLPRMTLSEHLDELRVRLFRSIIAIVVGMVVSFFFYEEIFKFVVAPFNDAAAKLGLDLVLNVIDPGESFMQVLKLCFLSGIVAVAPVVLWQMWGFVSSGLYDREKRYVRIFFPVSIGLFGLGLLAAYIILIPFGMRFLLGWTESLPDVQNTIRLESYISTCLTMVFAMGLLFELPLVMLFLQATDIVRRETFKKGWRVAVVVSFILGMLLTDPSPITQIMMAIPVVGLYWLGVWGGRFVGEEPEQFRIWKAWPLLLGATIFTLMLVYADTLNDWAAEIFGAGPVKKEAPEEGGM